MNIFLFFFQISASLLFFKTNFLNEQFSFNIISMIFFFQKNIYIIYLFIFFLYFVQWIKLND